MRSVFEDVFKMIQQSVTVIVSEINAYVIAFCHKGIGLHIMKIIKIGIGKDAVIRLQPDLYCHIIPKRNLRKIAGRRSDLIVHRHIILTDQSDINRRIRFDSINRQFPIPKRRGNDLNIHSKTIRVVPDIMFVNASGAGE